MYIIEYHRFVPDTLTWIGLVGLKIEQMHYHDEIDHVQNHVDQAFSLDKAHCAAKAWLSSHYGYVTILYDTECGPIKIRLCNHCKFIKKFLNQGVQLVRT